jgi:SnoaL-like protein
MTGAMDNLGTVRRIFNVLGRSGLDEIPDLVDKVCEHDVTYSGEGAEDGAVEGRVAVRARFREFLAACPEAEFDATNVEVISGSVIATEAKITGGSPEGGTAARLLSQVFVFDAEGLVVSIETFADFPKAIAAGKKAAK